jgi:hypothetical protein
MVCTIFFSHENRVLIVKKYVNNKQHKLNIMITPHLASRYFLFILQTIIFNIFILGDVSGELVYVNYGRVEDIQQLEQLGVNLTGHIAIARFGSCEL